MPSQVLPEHACGLLEYLAKPDEKANEDLALGYFRKLFGEEFRRQKDAHGSDGYVPGSFILELKGQTNDWLSGFFQALAYQNSGCDFSQIVVAAKNFLVIWRVKDIDESVRQEVICESGAPNQIGKRLAKKYARQKRKFLECAAWNASELSGSLFLSNPQAILDVIKSFEQSLRSGRKVRLKITPSNFARVLGNMKQFFNPTQPVKTVRAFYSMVYAWDQTSSVVLSNRANDQATLGGEVITDLVPSIRPMWIDADDLWGPTIPKHAEHEVFQYSFALGYAENECVETTFPADNPVKGAPEIVISNPLTPLSKYSFWKTILRPYCNNAPAPVKVLMQSVDVVFDEWNTIIRHKGELLISPKPYLLKNEGLCLGAGLVQIRDYAREVNHPRLTEAWTQMQTDLRAAKTSFFESICSASGINYFGLRRKKTPISEKPELVSNAFSRA